MSMDSSEDQVRVAQFCQEFIRQHGHPDRVFLENLRWDFLDPTGRSAVKGWIWDQVYWEYRDGRRIKYPSYAEFLSIETGRSINIEAERGELDRGTGNILPGRA